MPVEPVGLAGIIHIADISLVLGYLFPSHIRIDRIK